MEVCTNKTMQYDSARPWKSHEDKLIVKLVAKYGTKWSEFEIFFVKRSIGSIRNRWNRMQKFAYTHKYKCARCGLPRRGHICDATWNNEMRSLSAAANADSEVFFQIDGWPTVSQAETDRMMKNISSDVLSHTIKNEQ
jgi:hypothetical protein